MKRESKNIHVGLRLSEQEYELLEELVEIYRRNTMFMDTDVPKLLRFLIRKEYEEQKNKK